MNIHNNRQWQAGFTLCLLAVVVSLSQFRGTAATEDCLGKPYGTPGCPTKAATASAPSTSYCGNGIADEGEDCDKGRFNGKTDCSEQCHWLYCGDGILTKDLGEECEPETQEVYVLDEDGNLTTELQFKESEQCGWYCIPPVCDGEGNCHDGCKRQLFDSCDVAPATAASSSLAEEEIVPDEEITLVEPEPEEPVIETESDLFTQKPVCGNFVVETGEECDDGNDNALDACTTRCKRPHCGDRLVQEGEECDDGDLDEADTCTTACRVPRCGDGFVQKGEECDDSNTENNDYCTNDCKLPRCGDGIRQEPEECDDGNQNSDGIPGACRTICRKAFCGDRITDEGESCDAGPQNSNSAPNTCRLDCQLPKCGDGVTDGGEQCDDGNLLESDACSGQCRFTECGDGVVQLGEECDWGARNEDLIPDSCRTTCMLPRCGDGVVDAGEQCDSSAKCTAACMSVDEAAVVDPSEDTGSSDSGQAVVDEGTDDPELHAAAGPGFSIPLPAVAGVSAGLGVFLIFLWAQMKGFLRFGAKGGTLDDIPLDQIEMPYHRW